MPRTHPSCSTSTRCPTRTSTTTSPSSRRAGFWGVYLGIENLSTAVLRLMDKGTTGLLNIRSLKWCAEVGLTPDWAFLSGFPGEEPSEYDQLAELVPSLTHLRPPIGPYQI